MSVVDCHCVFGSWPKDPRDVSLGRLLRVLADLGIERAACTSLRGVFYDHEAGNAETLETCRSHPPLIPTATINPRHYFTRKNLPARFVAYGFRLLRLFPHIQGWSLQNVVVERIFREATDVKLPVAFPIGKLPDLASYLCRMVPSGCRLILSDVYYNSLAEIVEVMRRRPEFMMELGHTCTPGSIEYLCNEFGAARFVLGCNLPLESGRGTIEAIRRADISEEEKTAIVGGNLLRLLGEC